jgi:hypothetical protein
VHHCQRDEKKPNLTATFAGGRRSSFTWAPSP